MSAFDASETPKLKEKHRVYWKEAETPLFILLNRLSQTKTVWFDYPHYLKQKRSEEKGEKVASNATIRFRVHDDVWEYNSVCNAFRRSGFARTSTSYWNIMWSKHLTNDEYKQLKWFQRTNHFPGTSSLGRKDYLARSILKQKRKHPDWDVSFLPETYELPLERSLFELKFKQAPANTLWILKPPASSCGRGIKVISSLDEFHPKKKYMACRYIANPHLINGRKYDLRVYVLITCYNPLRVYVYKEGLVRLCTEPYTNAIGTLKKKFIHLTNYSVQKKAPGYKKLEKEGENERSKGANEEGADGEEEVDELEEDEEDEDVLSVRGDGGEKKAEQQPVDDRSAHKWGHSQLRTHLRETGIDDKVVFAGIHDVIVKTLLCVESHVSSQVMRLGLGRQSCFELVGFDVLLDARLKPWLLEVNVSPSLSSSSWLDKRIKVQMMSDVFHMVGVPLVDAKKGYDRRQSTEGGLMGTMSGSTSSSIRKHSNKETVGSGGGASGSALKRRATSSKGSGRGGAQAQRCLLPGHPSKTSEEPARSIVSRCVQQLKEGGLSYLQTLGPNDQGMLRECQEEFERTSSQFECVFPNPQTALQYEGMFDVPRYNNELVALWMQLPLAQRLACLGSQGGASQSQAPQQRAAPQRVPMPAYPAEGCM